MVDLLQHGPDALMPYAVIKRGRQKSDEHRCTVNDHGREPQRVLQRPGLLDQIDEAHGARRRGRALDRGARNLLSERPHLRPGAGGPLGRLGDLDLRSNCSR